MCAIRRAALPREGGHDAETTSAPARSSASRSPGRRRRLRGRWIQRSQRKCDRAKRRLERRAFSPHQRDGAVCARPVERAHVRRARRTSVSTAISGMMVMPTARNHLHERRQARRAECSACSCCRTPTGAGRQRPCASRCWRSGAACSAPCSISGRCRATTRRTTRRQPRTTPRRWPGETRLFNDDYVALMPHFDVTPRTLEVDAKEENGDVEAASGALKRSVEQALTLRGSRGFGSVESYQAFIDDTQRKAKKARGSRVAEQLTPCSSCPPRSSLRSARNTSASANGAPLASSTAPTPCRGSSASGSPTESTRRGSRSPTPVTSSSSSSGCAATSDVSLTTAI